MIGQILLSLGAIFIISCGTIHIFLTKSIINGFNIIGEQKRLTFMEWIVEGLTLYFVGILILIVSFSGLYQEFLSKILLWASFLLLLSMTVLSLMTVANLKTKDLNLQTLKKKIINFHLKSCPIVKLSSGILFLLATFV
jgi:hypothetical protein